MDKITLTAQPLENPHLLPPLTLAYIGDAVYELVVRRYLIKKGLVRPHRLHRETVKYVRAGAQADVLAKLMTTLTDQEANIVRRGRNAKTLQVPKGCNGAEYRYSTAFECLIGFLYLKGDVVRLNEILATITTIVNKPKGG